VGFELGKQVEKEAGDEDLKAAASENK